MTIKQLSNLTIFFFTSGCFGENQQSCAHKHCLLKFRDEFGNPSTITTTTVPVITTGIVRLIYSEACLNRILLTPTFRQVLGLHRLHL